MPTLLQHRRLTSLIVFLAILLNLCAPAIGRAVTLASDPLALDICSATAARDMQAPAKSPAHGVNHCVFCATDAAGEAPPPAPAKLLAVLDGHDDYHYPSATAPALPLAWSDAQPRGPPAAA